MPTERLSMRHIREVLRLHYSIGMSQRAVARSLGLAQGTVNKYLNLARRAGLTWPLSSTTMSGSRTGCFRRRPICPAMSGRNRIGRSFIASCGGGTSR